MGWLEGTVALITGGASGLGLAVAERFVAEGASVGVLDRSEEKLAALGDGTGRGILGIHGDVTDLGDNHRAVRAVTDRFGGLDTFVGNAGVWDWKVSLAQLPDDRIDAAFDELFAINVKGYLVGAKAAREELARRRGSMIFTVSNAGFYPDGGGPLYTASKHAVVGLVRQLAFELAPEVRVNGVSPGGMRTDLRGLRSLGQQGASLGERYDDMNSAEPSVPLHDVPEAPDLHTGPYVFLASRQNAAVVTGVVVEADRGMGVRGFTRPAPL